MVAFETVLEYIIGVRRANPRHNLATDKATVGDEIDEFNAKRLESMPGCESYLVLDTGGPPPKFQARSLPPRNIRDAVSAGIKGAMAGAQRLKVGIGVWMDWLGAGLQTMDHALAEKRAAVCVACALNQKPTTVAQWTYSKAAVPLSQYMQLKNDVDAKTSLDAQLFSCQACDCPMVLKVHCPLEHILSREKPEHLAKLDPACWIRKEKTEQDLILSREGLEIFHKEQNSESPGPT